MDHGILRFETLDDYIRENAIVANFYAEKFKDIENRDTMYEALSRKMIEVAQTTTAGDLTVSWLKANRKKFEITVTGLPTREEAEPEIKEQLIVEYYSR